MESVDVSTWQVIYPLYLDKEKTQALGRRVPKEKAVTNPTAEEIATVCKYFKLDHKLEKDKRHPADFFVDGRVRVKIKNADRSPCNPEVPNKHQLLLKMAELIPQLKTRTQQKSNQQRGNQSRGNKGNKGKKNTTTTSRNKKKGGKGKGGKKKGRRR